MNLLQSVNGVLGPGGALAQSQPHYQPRAAQLEMAAAVTQVLQTGGQLVVEAGTGVGKTYAYLVPLLLSRKPALISTATKALQDQLFARDLPALCDLLGLPVRTALLKGRASYLCLHRLASARQAPALRDDMLGVLAGIERWALSTRTGDLSEVQALDDSTPLTPWVTSTRENCLGAKCPQFADCHVYAARRQAMAADVVVINHHLFFADLNVRESGVAELLPSVRAVVFDEAHQLADVGVQFLGQQWSTGQLQVLAQDWLRQGQDLARGFADWEGHARALESAIHGVRLALGAGRPQRLEGEALDAAWAAMPVQEALTALEQALAQGQQALAAVADMAPELDLLLSRVEELAARVQQVRRPPPEGQVRWAEVSGQVRLVQSPLDIAHAMQTRVLQAQPGRAWIFTSATLGHEPSLSWFVTSCGLEAATTLQLPSPFDYARQAALYVPQEFPSAGDEVHSAAVADLAWQSAARLGGRTMVLTTTLRALRHIGQALEQRARQPGQALEVLVQGQAPKRHLLERFCRQRGQGEAGCLLVASASFWEGIDIPGDDLQLLVIDKLPFAPPDDPVLRARARHMEAQGQSAFKVLHLPLAAVALKQGAGRLIRRESDRGILVVCDARLSRMGYGRSLLKALPPMRRLLTPDDYQQALQALAQASAPAAP